jgi:hypothetical protein
MDDDGAMTQPASGPARAVGDRAVRVLIVDDERAFA